MKNLADTYGKKKNQNIVDSLEEVGGVQDHQYDKHAGDGNCVVS